MFILEGGLTTLPLRVTLRVMASSGIGGLRVGCPHDWSAEQGVFLAITYSVSGVN